jgi:hypothetical protein
VSFSELYTKFLEPYPDGPLLPRKPGNQLIEDYLRNLRVGIRTFLEKTLGGFYSNSYRRDKWYIFVVPYSLSLPEIQILRGAAIAAEFGNGIANEVTYITDPLGEISVKHESGIIFISDHKAYIAHCISTGLLDPQVDDVIMIVDMEESKVDIVSYEVTNLSPLSWEMCASSALQSSSTFKDLRLKFEEFVKARVKLMRLPDGSKIPARVVRKAVEDFDRRILADFRNNGQMWAVDVGLESEWPEAGIEEGYLLLSNDDILSCFEPVFNSLLAQIRDEVLAIQEAKKYLQVSFGYKVQIRTRNRANRHSMSSSKVVEARMSISFVKSNFISPRVIEEC